MSDIFIDYEYNHTNDPKLNLVCASYLQGNNLNSYWLHKRPHDQVILANDLMNNKGIIFSYNVVAEARAFISMGLNPLDFKWVDLYLEYRMVTNHNHQVQYGKQLIKGKVKTVRPPSNKWDMSEEEIKAANFAKPEHNLGAACFKMLGVQIDTAHKTAMRNLIISCPKSFSRQERTKVQEYCDSDVRYLPELWEEIKLEVHELIGDKQYSTYLQEAHKRAEYSVRTAMMEALGYPINYQATRNFADSVPSILFELQREINELFPEIQPFELNKKDFKFVKKEAKLRAWVSDYVEDTGVKWRLTDKGSYSLSLDAWGDHFSFRHYYPKDSFPAQILRYLKVNQNMNGFRPSKKRNFWDSVGSDNRSRPYMGIYGSQSARSQPQATGFIPLKAAWMRSLIQPPKGRAICSIDYKSEEFLISAILSGDKNMMLAYQSGDVYLYFAKLAGAVPWDGDRKDFKDIRNKFKSTTLGISYGMTKWGLSKKLTQDMGVEVDEDEAQDLIDLFEDAYPDYMEFITTCLDNYEVDRYLKLPCGWYMFGDNNNFRSVGNFPVQGAGSSVMREAVTLCQDAGLDVIFTLHDALYIEFDSFMFEEVATFADCMVKAFHNVLPSATKIGIDVATWSNDYDSIEEEYEIEGYEVKQSKIYVDERSKPEYEKFKKYFEGDEIINYL